HPGSEPSYNQSPSRGGKSGSSSIRNVRHGHIPRPAGAEARQRSGNGNPASARSRVGIRAGGQRNLPARGSGRRKHASKQHAGDYFGRQGRRSGRRQRTSAPGHGREIMIRQVVDFALTHRLSVVAFMLLLFI